MALLQYKISSKELATKTNVNIILPTPRADEFPMEGDAPFYVDGEKYQVLYLFHGTFGDSWDWMRFSRIECYAQQYQLAVVMPEVANSSFHNIPGSYAYYSYIAHELPTIINWTFPVSRRREDTFVAGLSMGGSGAFKIGMANPERFGAVASLSGGFGLHEKIENDRTCMHAAAYGPQEVLTGTMEDPYWQSRKLVEEGADIPKFYMCCGTEDDLVYQSNVDFKRHLDEIGFPVTWHQQPGGHSWDFWDDEIKRVLAWLPLKKGMVAG